MTRQRRTVQATVVHEDGAGKPVAVLIDDRYWHAAADQEAIRRREERRALWRRLAAAAGAELVQEFERAMEAERNRILRLFIKDIGRWLMEAGHRKVWEQLYLVLYEDGDTGEYLRDATDLHDYREHDEIRAAVPGGWRGYLAMIVEQEERAREQRAEAPQEGSSNG